jgi:small conductance mechanosensitive channel
MVPLLQADPPSWLPPWLAWFHKLGQWIVYDLGGVLGETFTGDYLLKSLVFVLLLGTGYLIGKAISHALRRSVLRPPRVDDAVARLLGHLIVFSVVLFGFSAGLTLFNTSLATIATGLGLLTLALGFGMQNTVANLMGGISLAIDKPFRPGDRIEVGNYWGTVQVIGLRSTRILTPKKETVIVPNKIMEEREIWNYTLLSPEYRLDLDLLVSHDSDWRSAEKIMTEVAHHHPNMLHYRPVQVLFRELSEAGVKLQLRAWLADVTLRAETTSELLKSIKDRFDESGIEIPLNYRTVVYKKDLPRPKRGPVTPITAYQRNAVRAQHRFLMAITGADDAEERALFATSLAKALGAGIVAVYLQEAGERAWEAEHSLRVMREMARNQRVWLKPIIRSGPYVQTLRELVRDEDVDLILVEEHHGYVPPWRRVRNMKQELRSELPCPIVTVPAGFKVTPGYVAEMQERIQAYRAGGDDESRALVEADLEAVGPSESPSHHDTDMTPSTHDGDDRTRND